ncbi:unnamed protein product, partial [Closterium sp. NIES-53]
IPIPTPSIFVPMSIPMPTVLVPVPMYIPTPIPVPTPIPTPPPHSHRCLCPTPMPMPMPMPMPTPFLPTIPPLPGFFLWLFLGHVNVRSSRRDVRFKVKEEYNSYRDRTALIFLGAPLLLLAAKQAMNQRCLPGLVVHVYQAWLLLFYTSLALRENILRINGSDIRPW